MGRKKYFIVFLVSFLIFSMLSVNAKKDVSLDVSLDDSEITAGDSFHVKINITNDGDDNLTVNDEIEIAIFIDNVIVHSDVEHEDIPQNTSKVISISSNKFVVDNDNIWGEYGLWGYKCGTHTIKVSIAGDVNTKSDTTDLKIDGDEIFVGIDPEKPTPGKEIEINVENTLGNKLDNANVRLTYLGENNEWDTEDIFREIKTDDGVAKFDALGDDFRFRNNPYGKYQLSVWTRDYCLYTTTFWVTNKLQIDEIQPREPFAGDEITVRVVDTDKNPVEGVRVTISGPSISGGVTYKTDSEGIARFILTETGNFNIIATKEDYEDSNIEDIIIRLKKAVDVEIRPGRVMVGRDITISVRSEGKGLNNATVIIRDPDDRIYEFTTSTDGEVRYKPNISGAYNVEIRKLSYETTTIDFIAKNFFNVSLPENIEIDKEINLIVADQNGNSVDNALISISGTSISGNTDDEGRFVFMLHSAGNYTLSIEKDGFETYTKSIIIYGRLTIRASLERISLRESSEISVLDEKSNNRVKATITISGPDNYLKVVNGDSYLFKPDIAGRYSVTASGQFYESAELELIVDPYIVDLDVKLVDEDIVVEVSRNRTPIENVSILIITPDGDERHVTTNQVGIARLSLQELNQTGLFKIMITEENYKSDVVILDTEGSNFESFTIILIILVLLTIMVLVVGVVFYLSHKGSGIGKQKKGLERRKKVGGLGNI
ncbi:MAG TPA: carboxypeptidase regulatory-like domain-containing protein [Candidatus Altiarchaeales archaeon]|nr:carboxypeptidase regulatory-like domain-containing protein [Candidatus Altiarchaeales archaeon]